MGRRKALIILPQLKNRKGDLKKEWFVEFSYRDSKTDKMIRKRIQRNINDFNTAVEREEAAKPIIIEFTGKLKSGWTPDDDDLVIYEDQLTYHHVAENYGKRTKSNRNVRFASSEFFEYKKPALKQKSYSSYLSKLRAFNAYCDNNNLSNVDISAIDNNIIIDFVKYLDKGRNLDKITIKKYRQVLFSFFKFCIQKKYIKDNPVHDIELPRKKVDNAARPMLQFDLDKLLNEVEPNDPQLYLALMIQFYSAIRPGDEMLNLKIKDLDFYNNQAVINAVDAKRGRRIARLPDQLVKIMIERYQLNTLNPEWYVIGRCRVSGPEKVGKNTLRNRFNQYRERLNLPYHYKYYSLKHTAAGLLLKNGFTVVEIQDWAGHASASSTEHYIRRHFGIKNTAIEHDFPDANTPTTQPCSHLSGL